MPVIDSSGVDLLAEPLGRGWDDRYGAPPVSLMNLPNALTVLRLILVPVFLLALFAQGGHDTIWRWIAWGVFAIAAITDRFDGHIARKRGQVTDFGKIADPIADKALTGSALIALSMLGDLAWWVTSSSSSGRSA